MNSNRTDSTAREVQGEVFEVLPGMGLAHVRAADGSVYAVSRQTEGVSFDTVRLGQQLRCEVAGRPARVLRARIVG